ncbi:MAG TPA: LytTR family DNA-binding domain-containing protein [Burkholderiaceae bacterium]|jgi:DNA-binding LytR/AlgR family response regulator
MTLTALIAEDEALLAQCLNQDLKTLWPELRVLSPHAAHGQQAVEQALAFKPDICFLDIRMPGMSGLEAAAAMAEDWPAGTPFPLIVFVTAYDQYALQAFEHAAVDYVLKPVQVERLALTVQRLQERLTKPGSLEDSVEQLRQLLTPKTGAASSAPSAPLKLLQVSLGNSIQMIPVEEIIYFEASDKYVRAVTAGKEHLLRVSLRELLPQLDNQAFWQVHRSLIVRAECIERAVRDESGKLTLHLRNSPDKLVVSRMHAHLFKGL